MALISSFIIENQDQFNKMQSELVDTIEKYTAEYKKDAKDQNEGVLKNLSQLMAMIAQALWSKMSEAEQTECTNVAMDLSNDTSLVQAICTV